MLVQVQGLVMGCAVYSERLLHRRGGIRNQAQEIGEAVTEAVKRLEDKYSTDVVHEDCIFVVRFVDAT